LYELAKTKNGVFVLYLYITMAEATIACRW
jgi:hypothetical protein